jgi:hypothetical protein
MSRAEKSKKADQKHETKKFAAKPSASSKKATGELNDEQLERIAGGAMSYSYHNQV